MEFKIERPVFDQDQLNKAYDYAKPKNSCKYTVILYSCAKSGKYFRGITVVKYNDVFHIETVNSSRGQLDTIPFVTSTAITMLRFKEHGTTWM
jgi:hypothetical protein